MWFSDEASFSVSVPLNRQNERFHRAAKVKTDISDDDSLVEINKQTQSILCYGAVSLYGKTQLRFIERYAAGQEGILQYRRKKKTFNQVVYREMFHQIFEDID